MGQIEAKPDGNDDKKVINSDNKNVLTITEKNSLNDVNIKMNETYNETKDENLEAKCEESDNNDNRKKVNGCDFACTIFFAMVAMLIFSTLSKTYTSYSGGSCGSVYAAQPLLAYTCVGLACAIIRSLRKQIKEQVKPMPMTTDELNSEFTQKNNSYNYELFTGLETPNKDPIDDTKPVRNNDISIEIKPKSESLSLVPDKPLTESIVFIPNPDKNKVSGLLPLPLLPPPSSKRRSTQTTTQSKSDLSVLSAIDLASIPTNVCSNTGLKTEPNEVEQSFAINSEFDINELNSLNESKTDSNLQNSNIPKSFWNNYDLNDKKY